MAENLGRAYVFPARAGMSRIKNGHVCFVSSVPRASGDEPSAVCAVSWA